MIPNQKNDSDSINDEDDGYTLFSDWEKMYSNGVCKQNF